MGSHSPVRAVRKTKPTKEKAKPTKEKTKPTKEKTNPIKEKTKPAKEKTKPTKEKTTKMTATATKRGRKRANDDPVVNEVADKKAKIVHVSHDTHKSVEGQVLTLGEGDTGQLGLGPDVMERKKPGKVDLPPNVVQVCAGGMHTVCLTATGQVYTWGCNDEGALGRKTPDEDDCMEPGKVDLEEEIVQISAGDSHTAAITKKGQLFGWGTFRDANGSIGLTTKGKNEVPIEMAPGLKIVRIASGADHLACLTTDGDLYTLGNAAQGQLGRVAECFSLRGGRKGLSFLLTPSKVHMRKRTTKFSNVWAGAYVTYAQTTTGEIFSWGLNNYFQLGFSDMKCRFVPECAKSFNKQLGWKEMSGGQHHTLALDESGRVYSLGRKEYGRLGLGEDVEKEKAEPTQVKALQGKKCVNVACGSAVSFAITENGDIYAWGMGTSGQLGQADEDDLWEPVKMTGKQLENRKSVMASAGGQHTVLLAQDNS